MNTKYRVVHGTMVGHEQYHKPPPEPWQELGAAIVLQAVKDYIRVLRYLWRGRGSVEDKRKNLSTKMEIERFFRSQWYEALSDIDPERLMRECSLQAKKKEREAIEQKNRRALRKKFMDAVD